MNLLRNPFPGVNPFLASMMQGEDRLLNFYISFAVHLADHLNHYLRRHYQARLEHLTRLPLPSSLHINPGYKEEQLYNVVLIESLLDPAPQNVVMVITLLMPEDKMDYPNAYLYHRRNILANQKTLLEIDWQHEFKSIVPNLPPYPDFQTASHSTLTLIDPPRNSMSKIFQVHLGDPLPTLRLPLLGNETVLCNFDQVYQETFVKGRFGNYINYEALPDRFEKYSPKDQDRIRAILEQLRLEEKAKGGNLLPPPAGMLGPGLH